MDDVEYAIADAASALRGPRESLAALVETVAALAPDLATRLSAALDAIDEAGDELSAIASSWHYLERPSD